MAALAGQGEERRVKTEESARPFSLHPSPSARSTELRAVAVRLLAEARSAPATRDTALTVLAADTLITLAVEGEIVGEEGVGP